MPDLRFAHRLGPSVGNPLAPGGMTDSSGRGRPPLRRSCWRPSTVGEVILMLSHEGNFVNTEMSVHCRPVVALWRRITLDCSQSDKRSRYGPRR
jgi:hypothetical protein